MILFFIFGTIHEPLKILLWNKVKRFVYQIHLETQSTMVHITNIHACM